MLVYDVFLAGYLSAMRGYNEGRTRRLRLQLLLAGARIGSEIVTIVTQVVKPAAVAKTPWRHLKMCFQNL